MYEIAKPTIFQQTTDGLETYSIVLHSQIKIKSIFLWSKRWPKRWITIHYVRSQCLSN